MFARREKRGLLPRLRDLIWPRLGIRRYGRYLAHRLARLPGSSYSIAGGVAWGTAVSFTPFIGLHIVMAMLGAWLSRCNLIAAAIGTAAGNPWTFPLIWTWCHSSGSWLLGRSPDAPEPSIDDVFGMLGGGGADWEGLRLAADGLLVPMVAGGALNAGIAWLVTYVAVHSLVAAYRRRRRARLAERANWGGIGSGDVPHI